MKLIPQGLIPQVHLAEKSGHCLQLEDHYSAAPRFLKTRTTSPIELSRTGATPWRPWSVLRDGDGVGLGLGLG